MDHVVYEVEQLHGLIVRFREIGEHDREHGERDLDYLDMATRNAQVDSFAIHVRALVDFLYDQRGKDTDVIASDYVPTGWTPPKQPESLRSVKPRVGKEIAHMSYRRVGMTDEQRQWRYVQVWHDLSTILRAFVAKASTDLLPKEVTLSILACLPPKAERLRLVTSWQAAESQTATNRIGPGTATYRLP